MDSLKREFVLGFNEGWKEFWSPFVALYRALATTWKAHLSPPHHH
jgi:hypothetical protein